MTERTGQLTRKQTDIFASRCDMWASLLGEGIIASIGPGEIQLSVDVNSAKEARSAHASDIRWLRNTARILISDPESGARNVDVLLHSVLAGFINFDNLVPNLVPID